MFTELRIWWTLHVYARLRAAAFRTTGSPAVSNAVGVILDGIGFVVLLVAFYLLWLATP